MRYLGNKDLLIDYIKEFLNQKNLLNNNLIFFDAFCGTGAVANGLKRYYKKIVINDNLKWAILYSNGKIFSSSKKCVGLIEKVKQKFIEKEGFIYSNYSYGPSSRMYFTENNGKLIDSYRFTIEEMFKSGEINFDEYSYLLYRLIEGVSDVSNTAGVYGAFLKKWDNRALKPFEITDKIENESTEVCVEIHNSFIEDIIFYI